MNGLATNVATQLLQLGAVSANSAIRSILVIVFIAVIVVVAVATIVVLFFISDFFQNGVSQKYDVIIRNFNILKYQNTLTFTIRPIV